MKDVDAIADGIRDRLLEYAPKLPSEAEYRAIVAAVAGEHGHRVLRHGRDVEERRFVEVEKLLLGRAAG